MKLSLRTKIFGGFLIITLLFLFASAYSFLNANNLDKKAKRNSGLFDEYRTVSDLDRRVREEKTMLLRYTNSNENKDKQAFFKSQARFKKKLSKLTSFYLLEKREKNLLDNIARENQMLNINAGKLFKLPPSSPQKTVLLNQIDDHINKIMNDLDKHRDIDKTEIHENLRQINLIRNAERDLAFGVLFLVLLSLTITFFSTKYITAPIAKLRQEVRKISHGHLNRRISLKTGDEIEDLANTFNQMIAGMYAEEQLAARLQKRLLPPKKIRVKGVKLHAQQIQAKVVGGDWYDYYRNGNEIAFFIADASGKGMSGALLATLAMSSIRCESKSKQSIEKILINTNKTIERRLGAGNFVTLFYGSLSPETNELQYVNCGHELPLFYRSATDNWSLLECRGSLPLGISTKHFHPRRDKICLQKGDKIIFYTDGLHDVRDKQRR
ncbi:MAG TPA: HAMP domain-containing protein, partial [Actinobacteria bacterium]|nr:HAMP domain-containing protein [Actinomycetes bacterium]HEX21028.1 HAMP domain-containing protein [Actinomycetota bacterium]